jgi:hypothetical protein
MQAKEILKEHIAKTIKLTDDQFGYFFSHFKQQSFKKGQAIVSAGDKVDCEYFVLEGCLKGPGWHLKQHHYPLVNRQIIYPSIGFPEFCVADMPDPCPDISI